MTPEQYQQLDRLRAAAIKVGVFFVVLGGIIFWLDRLARCFG